MKKQIPVVSVVIPAYNEEKRIASCLAAIKKQDFQYPYQIIVCDDNSTDSTAAIAKRYGATVVLEKKKGLSHASNAGVQAASAPLILMTDADTVVPLHWISAYYSYFQKHTDLLAASGPFIYTNESPFMHGLTIFINALAPRLLAMSTNGVNMGFRRKAFDAVGGFDPKIHLQTDSYFGIKVARIGKIGFLSHNLVITSGRRFTSIILIIREGCIRWCNLQSLRLFDRPLTTDFQDIR